MDNGIRDLMLALDKSINEVRKCAACGSVQCPVGHCIFGGVVYKVPVPMYATPAEEVFHDLMQPFKGAYKRLIGFYDLLYGMPKNHPRHIKA